MEGIMAVENEITMNELLAVTPKKSRALITQEFIDNLNGLSDPETAPMIRSKFMDCTSVLEEGKYKLEDYKKAVEYAVFKSMGMSNYDAYCHAFPDRVARLQAIGKTHKDISSYVFAYNSGALVQAVLEKNKLSDYIKWGDARDIAMRKLLDIAMYGKSEKNQRDACDSILKYTQPPEDNKNSLQINIQKNTFVNDIEASLNAFAKAQKEAVDSGKVSLSNCIEAKIVNE